MSGLAIDQFRTEGPQMSTFQVDICRTAYSFARIPVRASNLAEAQLKALDVSGDQLYTEKSSEYTVPKTIDKHSVHHGTSSKTPSEQC